MKQGGGRSKLSVDHWDQIFTRQLQSPQQPHLIVAVPSRVRARQLMGCHVNVFVGAIDVSLVVGGWSEQHTQSHQDTQ